jgi:hypothetical protein
MNIKYIITYNLESVPTYPDIDSYFMEFSTKNPYFQEYMVRYIANEYYSGADLGNGDIRYFTFWDEYSAEFLGTYKAEGYTGVAVEKVHTKGNDL